MLIKKIASKRMAILRISVILIIIFIILDNNFSAYTLDIDMNTSVLFSYIGFTFVVLGGFGRIWASLYLEGFMVDGMHGIDEGVAPEMIGNIFFEVIITNKHYYYYYYYFIIIVFR